MIDIKARIELTELIRQLVAGFITADEFDDAIPISDDEAVSEIYFSGPWHFYSDWTDRLVGKNKVSKDNKKIVARWLLFLKNNQEYNYPKQRPIDAILGILTLGLWMKKVDRRFEQAGDTNYWPFISQERFEEAKNEKGYLGHI